MERPVKDQTMTDENAIERDLAQIIKRLERLRGETAQALVLSPSDAPANAVVHEAGPSPAKGTEPAASQTTPG